MFLIYYSLFTWSDLRNQTIIVVFIVIEIGAFSQQNNWEQLHTYIFPLGFGAGSRVHSVDYNIPFYLSDSLSLGLLLVSGPNSQLLNIQPALKHFNQI